MTSTTISHALPPASSLLIASPISATRVTASPRRARMMPTCSAWSPSSSMSSTLFITGLGESNYGFPVRMRNQDFPTGFKIEDGDLIGAKSEFHCVVAITNQNDHIQNVAERPIIEPRSERMGRLQQKVQVCLRVFK